MTAITIQGNRQKYLFSVITADCSELPDWGGIYIAVKASSMGMKIENCYMIGSCESFSAYKEKIKALLVGECTHVYLLPEYDDNQRKFALEDLMEMETFRNAMLQSMEHFENLHMPDNADSVNHIDMDDVDMKS